MYLGVDLYGIATDALRDSQVIDHEELAVTDSPEKTPSSYSEEASRDRSPSSSETKTGAQAESTAPPESKSKPTQKLTEAEREKATHDYWKVLTACVQEEVLGRRSGVKNIENWQLLDHLTHRLEGHQRVVDQIEQLDDQGVDPRVTFHAKQVLAWHRAGVNLNGRALGLITDGPKADLTGPVAQSWQSAATQHRMEEKLVQEKHLGVASYLAHTYKTWEPSKPGVRDQASGVRD